MNKQPIEEARDSDLRFSMQALQRAAKRAREMAAKTGTCVVIVRNGRVEQVSPEVAERFSSVNECAPDYNNNSIKP